MKWLRQIVGTLVLAATVNPVYAGSITQSFASSWTIAPFEYYGFSAWHWEYSPYSPWDNSLGSLKKVVVTTEISGVKDSSDTVAIRYAFFTGWNPAQYQFYDGMSFEEASNVFSASRTFSSDGDFSLTSFIDYLYLPKATYYFESRSATTHQIDALTKIIYNYDTASDIPEPSSWYLMVLGAAAFCVNRRTKKTIKHQRGRLLLHT